MNRRGQVSTTNDVGEEKEGSRNRTNKKQTTQASQGATQQNTVGRTGDATMYQMNAQGKHLPTKTMPPRQTRWEALKLFAPMNAGGRQE